MRSSPSYNTMNAPASVSAGTWMQCEGLANKTVFVYGTFVATLQVQVTVDTDTDPVNISVPLTSAGAVSIPHEVKKVRINTQAYTSGTPKAVLSFNE